MAMMIKRPSTAFSLDPADKTQKRIEDEKHLDFIRQLPSVIDGKGPCEACHIRTGSPAHRKKRTGMGRKPDDAWTLPMTPAQHRAQHDMNELEFYQARGIEDPFGLASALYSVSGNVKAARAIIREHIAQRRIK